MAIDATIRAELEKRGNYITETVLPPEEDSVAAELCYWVSERMADTHLFKIVEIAAEVEDGTKFPRCVVVPGNSETEDSSNRSVDISYDVGVYFECVYPHRHKGTITIIALRDRLTDVLRQKAIHDRVELPKRGSEVKEVDVTGAPLQVSQMEAGSYQFTGAVLVTFTVREPRRREDQLD